MAIDTLEKLLALSDRDIVAAVALHDNVDGVGLRNAIDALSKRPQTRGGNQTTIARLLASLVKRADEREKAGVFIISDVR